MSKSRYWFSAYSAMSRRGLFRKVVESTEGSLRLFDPLRRDNIVRILVFLGFEFGVLIVYGQLVPLTASRLIPPQPANSLTAFSIIDLLGFLAILYYSIRLSDRFSTDIELRLAAKHSDRVFPVHVMHVKPPASRGIQLLRLVGDRKDEWFRVHVFGPDLIEALKLANENIKLELNE